jgi:hypothetical protein
MVRTDVTAERGGSRDARLPGNSSFPTPGSEFLLINRGTFWLLEQHCRSKQTIVIAEFLFFERLVE